MRIAVLVAIVLAMALLLAVEPRTTRSRRRRAKADTDAASKAAKSAIPTSKATLSSDNAAEEPFSELANFLLENDKKGLFNGYAIRHINRALNALAASQAAVKSMDGATHSFRNTFKASSSLTSRYDKFMSGSKRNYKEAAKVLEYTRAVERGLQAMEILQAVFPEDTAVREKFTAAAGLQELKRFSVTANGMTCSVVVLNPVGGSNQADIGAILGRSTTADGNTNSNETTKMISDRERKERSTPQRFNRDELVLAIVDEAGFLDTLTGVNVEPQALPLSGIGFSREEITIHPTILSLAIQVISGIKDFIVDNSKQSIAADGVDDSINATNAISLQSLNTTGGNSTNDVGVDVVDLRIVFNNKIAPSISGTAPSRGKYETNENKVDNKSTNRTSKVDSSTGEKHEKVMRKLVDRAISGSSSIKQIDSITKDILTVNSTSTSEIKTVLVKATPNSIRIVGHSVGSSVGALVSLVLDGALNSTKLADFVSFGKKSNKKFKKSSKLSKGQEAVVEVPLPPASSLNINATGVTSMKFPYVGLYKDRIACVCVGPVPCISRSIVPKFVTSIVNGDDFIARLSYESMKELQQRMQDALKAGAGKGGFSSLGYKLGTGFMGDLAKVGGTAHDLSTLQLPGRVFFIKSRQLKQGATIQRILRGNWQEDMLWQIHDILISKKMLQHHSLEAYIKTLNRC